MCYRDNIRILSRYKDTKIIRHLQIFGLIFIKNHNFSVKSPANAICLHKKISPRRLPKTDS